MIHSEIQRAGNQATSREARLRDQLKTLKAQKEALEAQARDRERGQQEELARIREEVRLRETANSLPVAEAHPTLLHLERALAGPAYSGLPPGAL